VRPRAAAVTALWIVVAVALVYQAAVVALVVVAWRNPRLRHRRDPAGLGIGFEEVRFPTSHGRQLYGWWIPSAADAPVVILVHGWGRNVERMLPYIAMLHPAGFGLLAFDARHHGSSDGDRFAAMPKFSEDIRAAVDFLDGRRALGGRPVGVLGLSVGGSASIHAASADHRIAAVATVGAFADPSDARATLGRHWWLLAPGLPLAFRFAEYRVGARFRRIAPERVIGAARARFLLIHGTEDVVVPVAHAQRLADAAGPAARTWIIPGRGHSDPHLDAAMAPTLTDFFAEVLGPPAGGGSAARGGSLTAPPGGGLRSVGEPRRM
jgi:pimeloyl-ACP methyl ester carboxylesterase